MFESIKSKIEAMKSKKAKAEGALETIVASWKSAHGISTLEEAENLLKEMTAQKEELSTEIDSLYSELSGLTNWGLV
jgi:hypothetical protein